MTYSLDLVTWGREIYSFKLPRWKELPHIELYIDQLIEYVEYFLPIFYIKESHPLLTKSMINNYVKEEMIPKPVNRKYNRKHLAYLIAITILKRVFTISDIHDGIVYQAKISNISAAYDTFCQAQEHALKMVSRPLIGKDGVVESSKINLPENTLVYNASMSVAAQLVAKRIIHIELQKENFYE